MFATALSSHWFAVNYEQHQWHCSDCQPKFVFWHIQIVSRLILKKVWPQKSHVKSHEATFGDGLKLQSDIYRCIPDALGAQIRFQSVFCIVTRHIDVKFKVAEVH